MADTTQTPAEPSSVETTDWRCPQMSRHMGTRANKGVPLLPAPCPDCFSVRVVEYRMPLDLSTVARHAPRWIVLDPSLTTRLDNRF